MAKFEKEMEAAIAAKFGFSKSKSNDILNFIEAHIKQCVKDGKDVQWTAFMKITKVSRGARSGRNPATGETINIPAKDYVRVKVSPSFTDMINE